MKLFHKDKKDLIKSYKNYCYIMGKKREAERQLEKNNPEVTDDLKELFSFLERNDFGQGITSDFAKDSEDKLTNITFGTGYDDWYFVTVRSRREDNPSAEELIKWVKETVAKHGVDLV